MAKFNLHELQKKLKDAVAKSGTKRIVYNGSKTSNITQTAKTSTTAVKKKGCGCGGR
jgi:hypothetical protein